MLDKHGMATDVDGTKLNIGDEVQVAPQPDTDALGTDKAQVVGFTDDGKVRVSYLIERFYEPQSLILTTAAPLETLS